MIKKQVESIKYNRDKREVEIIIKNCSNDDSFSRVLNPMVKRVFSKWISKKENKKLINFNDSLRFIIQDIENYNAGEQTEFRYKYKGIIKIK